MSAFMAMIASLLSWGFSMIFAGILMREISKRIKGIDYRAMGAAGYLGLGSVWALGLSSSAALLMATKGSIPPGLLAISGIITLKATLFTWQNLVMIVVLVLLSMWICYVSTPTPDKAKTAEMAGITYQETQETIGTPETPGEQLEFSPVLTMVLVALGVIYLVDLFSAKGGLAALDLNTYNFMFLIAGMLLHWRPRAFLRAAAKAVPMTGGVLLQFPLYAGIFGVLMGSKLNEVLARFFVSISNHGALPLVGGVYSAILGSSCPRAAANGWWRRPTSGRRQSPAREPGLDGAGLQRRRSAAQLHQPLLDAAPHGPHRGQGQGPGRLFHPAAALPSAGGADHAVAAGPDPALRAADAELTAGLEQWTRPGLPAGKDLRCFGLWSILVRSPVWGWNESLERVPGRGPLPRRGAHRRASPPGRPTLPSAWPPPGGW